MREPVYCLEVWCLGSLARRYADRGARDGRAARISTP
jgi:hypothetical protein